MISKDTAWIDDDGKIVRQTITRPLSGPWDFLNTYIVNIYPDTTCWVNDFKNADNERYMKLYFNQPAKWFCMVIALLFAIGLTVEGYRRYG